MSPELSPSQPIIGAPEMTARKPPWSLADLPPEIRTRITVDPTWGCWIWNHRRGLDYLKYGSVLWQGTNWRVHRLVYTLLVGPIPEDFDIDHVYARGCRSRSCCWPEHLEAVPGEVNSRRGQHANITWGPARTTSKRIALGRTTGSEIDLADAIWMLPLPALGDSGVRPRSPCLPPIVEGDPAYGIPAAAIELGISRKELVRLRKTAKGPRFFQVCGRYYYRKSALDEWKRQRDRSESA